MKEDDKELSLCFVVMKKGDKRAVIIPEYDLHTPEKPNDIKLALFHPTKE